MLKQPLNFFSLIFLLRSGVFSEIVSMQQSSLETDFMRKLQDLHYPAPYYTSFTGHKIGSIFDTLCWRKLDKMRLSSTIILITWCLTFIVIASIFVAKKVVMKNRIVIRYRNSYAINLVTNSEKPKIIVKYNMTFKFRHV